MFDEGWPLVLLLAGVALVAAALVYVAIPRAMPFFLRYALSRPNARSSHKVPTPQGGGAPVVLAVLAAIVGLGVVDGLDLRRDIESFFMLTAAAAFAMALIGAADDMRPMPAVGRLFFQLVLTAVVVFGAPEDWRVIEAVPLGVERGLAVVAGVWFVNLTNFMDGIDGILVAEFVPLSAVLAVVSAVGIVSSASGVVAAALCGALLGFAPFNRHPARLFLGDVGSLPIGLLVAALLFELAARGHIAAAVLLPMYFLFDATETLVLGLLRGHNVLAAHRRHAYQNAVDGGMPVQTVSGEVLMLNLLLAVLSLASIVAETALLDGVLVILGLNATLFVSRRFRSARR